MNVIYKMANEGRTFLNCRCHNVIQLCHRILNIVFHYWVAFNLKPLAAKNVYEVWQKKWDKTGLVSNTFHEILPKLLDKLLSFCNTRKEKTVLNRLHIGHSYLTRSFILRKEEASVCVVCNTALTVNTSWLNVLICWKLEKHISNKNLCIHSFGM